MALFDLKEIGKNFALCEDTEDDEKVITSSKFMTMNESIGDIRHGHQIHFVTSAYWSMYELLAYVINQIGPADVDAFTWNISNPAVVVMKKMKDKGQIKKLRFVIHSAMMKWTRDAVAQMQNFADKISLFQNHAKGFVCTNDEWAISVVASSNFSNNPQIEAGVISTNENVAKHHKKWLDSIFENNEFSAENYVKIKPIKETDEKIFIVAREKDKGKAKKIFEKCHSFDDFFNAISGENTFDKRKLNSAYAQFFNNVKLSFENNEKKVCAVFGSEKEISEVIKLAEKYNYEVVEL